MAASHFLVTFCVLSYSRSELTKPHIVVIVADDLGWNDVSFHGSDEILTPNIDSLAYNGVIIHHHYTQSLCTPSRAALLTGLYPIHTGMQVGVILEPEPWGLPLNFKIMPQHLNSLGYTSHAVGKWHLGYFKKAYTPLHRGFSTHFGFWNGYQDYYKHTVQASFSNYEGFDMRVNDEVAWNTSGQYSTDLFTKRAVDIISGHDRAQPLFLYLAHLAPHAGNYDDPLQAPQDSVDRFTHIPRRERRLYAGMVSKLDDSVGEVIEALNKADMLQNSIIVFLSDNGAATTGLHVNYGSNWPLKGEKGTPWEGAIRTVSFLWSPLLTDNQRVFHDLMHITDWLPTLYSAAGGHCEDLGNVDGVSQWNALVKKSANNRHEILHNIDDKSGYSAIRVGQFKYVNGTTLLGFLDQWSGKEEHPYKLPLIVYGEQVLSSSVNRYISKTKNNSTYSGLNLLQIKNIRDLVTIKCRDSIKNKIICSPLKTPCIFNINNDPCEQKNLYGLMKNTGIVQDFENRLKRQRKNALIPQNKLSDSRADPHLHNNVWTSWQD